AENRVYEFAEGNASLDFLLTLCLFFIRVRELRYASVASFASRQKKIKKQVHILPNFCLYLYKTRYFYSIIYAYNLLIINRFNPF
ncbi:MAG: hypothetical protein LBE11_08550, partial [Prevotellaceae bacterium]|nr:hypothetical protein [Prevotellaceae bacterium]